MSSAVWRVLYRGLLRTAERYDRYPLSKVYLEYGGKKKYTPTVSLREEIRKNWRATSEHNLLNGFDHYKYLRTTFHKMEQSLPWYNQLTLQTIEPVMEQVTIQTTVLQKPVLSNEIKPGNVLLAHPSISGYYSRSVILLIKQTNDSIWGLVIPGLKANHANGLTFWQGGLVNQEFWLLLTNQNHINATPVLKNLSLAPLSNPQDVKLFPSSEARIFCSVCKWSPATLASEIEIGQWFITECPPELLFPVKQPEENSQMNSDEITFDLTDDGTKTSDLWKKIMRALGGEYSIFSYIDGLDIPKVRDQSKIA